MARNRSPARVAVIGDVGGHVSELRAELDRLGADPVTGSLPGDLTVVQVGDLVHRGPDSTGVLALVDGYLRDQPAQWVQLVGNHEAQYLRPPAFAWPERLDAAAADTLRRWWDDGRMIAAVALSAGTENFLITHAGLTQGFWQQVLGGVDDPVRAAAALNSFIGRHEDVLFHAGQMLGGRPDMMAGPVWASAATELLPSWLATRMPFSQVHGHTAATRHPGRRRSRAVQEAIRRTVVDEERRHESTELDGGRIIGVDPGHSTRPRPAWRAWEPDRPATLIAAPTR